MTRPERGVAAECDYIRTRDGDTVEISIGGDLVWAIRLINVWCPELRTGEQRQQAAAAKAFVEEVMQRADPDELLVQIKWPRIPKQEKKRINPLKLLTFDRVPGFIWIGDVCLNELIVAKAYASSTKGGVLGV